jgi:PAS domain S-box-containing protein
MGSDARFVYVNEAACQVLGYTKENLVNMTVYDIDPNMTADLWLKHWEDLKQFRSFTMDSIHRTKSGRIFPVEVSVNMLEFEDQVYNCVYARDISERQKQQTSTDTSLCSFQNFADNTEHGIAVISPRKTVLYMNRQLKQQYPDVDLSKGPQCYELFNGGSGNGICPGCPVESTVEQGATCRAIVSRITQDGRKQFNITTSPIRAKDGEIVAFVENMSDCLDRFPAMPTVETADKNNLCI